MKKTVLILTALLMIFGSAIAQVDSSFHLYLLVGQSNMAGRGGVSDESLQYLNEDILMLSKENDWIEASDPTHFDRDYAAVGPAMSFANEMLKVEEGVTIGLIPCAWGGSEIRVWSPGASFFDVKPYDFAVSRTKLAMQTGVLKGILWHQGESDNDAGRASAYLGRFKTLINNFRTAFENQDLPFIAGEIGYFNTADFINAEINKITEEVPHTSVVSAVDLTDVGDNLHFNTESARVLGRRYAAAMQKQLGYCSNVIEPLFKIDNGVNRSGYEIAINEGKQLDFSPEANAEGTWTWSGCDVVHNDRELSLIPSGGCELTVSFTNMDNCISQTTYKIVVNKTLMIEEGEDGFCFVDGVINESLGYADTYNEPEYGINWSVTVPEDNVYKISWNYSSLENSFATFWINGESINDNMFFAKTDDGVFKVSRTWDITLGEGLNEIRLQSKDEKGLPWIDNLQLFGVDPNPVSCEAEGKAPILGNDIQSKISFHPNPIQSGENLQILTDKKELDISIYNLNGRLEFQTTSLSTPVNLSAGVYIVQMAIGGEVISEKLVVR